MPRTETIPTIESMKMIGLPASVRATNNTPSPISADAPVASTPQIISQTTTAMAAPASAPVSPCRIPAAPRSRIATTAAAAFAR